MDVDQNKPFYLNNNFKEISPSVSIEPRKRASHFIRNNSSGEEENPVFEQIKKMLPFVLISALALLFGFIMCVLIYKDTSVQQMFTVVEEAQDIINDFNKQYSKSGFSAIKNGLINKNGEVECGDGWKQEYFGSLSSTDKGCICPNLQTQTQSCDPPCSQVPNIASTKYKKFLNTSICVQKTNNESEVLNVILLLTEGGEGENQIKLGNQVYQFMHSPVTIEEMDYYAFQVSPDAPCNNPSVFPFLKSFLNYPFLTKPFTGCDIFGNKVKEAFKIAQTSQGKLFAENNFQPILDVLPMSETFFRADDPLNLYVISKVYIDPHQQCQLTFDYPFKSMYQSCLIIQVFVQVLCQFAFIFFLLMVCFIVYTLVLYLLLRRKDPDTINYKTQSKWNLLEVCLRSIVIMNGVLVISILITYVARWYGVNNSYGLDNTNEILSMLLSIPCFQNQSMNLALLSLQSLSRNCGSFQQTKFEILLYGQIFFILVAIFVFWRYKNTKFIFHYAKKKKN